MKVSPCLKREQLMEPERRGSKSRKCSDTCTWGRWGRRGGEGEGWEEEGWEEADEEGREEGRGGRRRVGGREGKDE